MRYRRLAIESLTVLGLLLYFTAALYGLRVRFFHPQEDLPTHVEEVVALDSEEIEYIYAKVEQELGQFQRPLRLRKQHRLNPGEVAGYNKTDHTLRFGPEWYPSDLRRHIVNARLAELNVEKMPGILRIGICEQIVDSSDINWELSRKAPLTLEELETANPEDEHARASAHCVLYFLCQMRGKPLQSLVGLQREDFPQPADVWPRVATYRVIESQDRSLTFNNLSESDDAIPLLFEPGGLLKSWDEPWPLEASQAEQKLWANRCMATGLALEAWEFKQDKWRWRSDVKMTERPSVEQTRQLAMEHFLNRLLFVWGGAQYMQQRLPISPETRAEWEKVGPFTRAESIQAPTADSFKRARVTALRLVDKMIECKAPLSKCRNLEATEAKGRLYDEDAEPAAILVSGPKLKKP